MDYVNKFTGGGNKASGENQQQNNQGTSLFQGRQGSTSSSSSAGSGSGNGGLFGGLGDKLNSAAGGGRESEKDEDLLDKAVDFVQEKFLGQGPQDNESALEQAKDEKISDFIRGRYKGATGRELPIKDKPTRFG